MPTYLVIILIAAIIISIFIEVRKQQSWQFWASRSGRDRFANQELVSALLHLPEAELKDLFDLYKREFGPGPARYARRTLKKWKVGKVQPATQTFQRFLIHLPSVMSYDMKCEVLRHFMETYSAKDEYNVEVFTDDWETVLEPLVTQIIDKAFTAQLPDEVERKLRWLGDGDMRAAQEILRHSQAEEIKIMVGQMRNEFAAIDELLSHDHLKPRVTHVLDFPYGTINLKVKRRTDG